MKTKISCLGLVIILFVAMPVFADDMSDYINEEVDEWIRIADNNGYEILGTYRSMIIEEGFFTYYIELTPGIYRFYSSGGLHIEDLDLYINDFDGNEISNDTLEDKIPIVVIQIKDTEIVEVLVSAYSLEEGYDQDSFCLLVTCENEGEILSLSYE